MTDSVAPAHRLAFWRFEVGRLLTHLEVSSDAGQEFAGIITAHQSFPTNLFDIGAATHAIARARPKISQVGEEQIFVCIQVDGEAQVEQDTRNCCLRPGDMTMLDTSRSFRADFPGGMSQWVLQVPRAVVRRQVGTVERFTASVVPSENLAGDLTRSFIGALVRNFTGLEFNVGQRYAEHATEMALTAFTSSFAGSDGGPTTVSGAKAMLAHRARIFIEENLREPTLKPAQIADHLGISTRYLNSVFAIHGQSVERFIWERRIARCARDLKDPGQRGRAIGEIAFSWGFHSLAHFSQAFKAVHGRSPREYRREPHRDVG